MATKKTATKKRAAPKRRTNPLQPGDVLLTHPLPGYWGCAVVLTARDETKEHWPDCHIGTTTIVSREPISARDVDLGALKLHSARMQVRVGPGDFREEAKPRTAIGLYVLPKKFVPPVVLGRVDPATLWPHALTYKAGDGTGRTFPHCGQLDDSLGDEAVASWREVHDAEAFAREIEEAEVVFAEFERTWKG